MNFANMLIGFLLVAVVFFIGTFMIVDLNNNYREENISIESEDFNDTFNYIDEIYDISSDGKDKTLDAEIEGGSESWESMTKGSYGAVRLIGKSFGLMENVTTSMAAVIGVPGILKDIAVVGFGITIIFGIVYMIFRYKP